MTDPTPQGKPRASIASLIASSFVIDLACSFTYYGLLRGETAKAGWPLFLTGWALVILLPVFGYLRFKRGSVKAAFGPFMLFFTPGLLLGMVFPFALL